MKSLLSQSSFSVFLKRNLKQAGLDLNNKQGLPFPRQSLFISGIILSCYFTVA